MDQWERSQREVHELRLALVASGRRDAEEIFPQHFQPTQEQIESSADAIMDPENAIDFSEVVFTPATEEQYQEYLRLMMEAEEEEGAPEEGEPEAEQEWL